MKAAEITDRLIDELATGRYRHARVNYANGDMVGHTGDRDAAILAVEAVDLQLAPPAAGDRTRCGGALIVTADHGNADDMFELDAKTGRARARRRRARSQAKTSHTLNPVPLHVFAPRPPARGWRRDALARGSPTSPRRVLQLLGYARRTTTRRPCWRTERHQSPAQRPQRPARVLHDPASASPRPRRSRRTRWRHSGRHAPP